MHHGYEARLDTTDSTSLVWNNYSRMKLKTEKFFTSVIICLTEKENAFNYISTGQYDESTMKSLWCTEFVFGVSIIGIHLLARALGN